MPWLNRNQMIVVATLVVVPTATIALPFVFGSTFGQRCERMHPGDGAAIEQCVAELTDPTRAAYRKGYHDGLAAMVKIVGMDIDAAVARAAALPKSSEN